MLCLDQKVKVSRSSFQEFSLSVSSSSPPPWWEFYRSWSSWWDPVDRETWEIWLFEYIPAWLLYRTRQLIRYWQNLSSYPMSDIVRKVEREAEFIDSFIKKHTTVCWSFFGNTKKIICEILLCLTARFDCRKIQTSSSRDSRRCSGIEPLFFLCYFVIRSQEIRFVNGSMVRLTSSSVRCLDQCSPEVTFLSTGSFPVLSKLLFI